MAEKLMVRECSPKVEVGGDFLRWYSCCYEHLRAFCIQTQWMQTETVLRYVESVALYASTHHPGRLDDGTIENIALEIGRDLDPFTVAEASRYIQRQHSGSRKQGKRRILHVSPYVWRVGGHTRTLRNWITIDQESQHSLILTQTMDPSLLTGMQEEIWRNGGELIVLPERLGLLTKAKVLRAIAQSSADLIVLHHSCNDVVPIVAFAIGELPPVAFVNDCDQAFWLGASIADIIVNQREVGARLSAQRRATTRNTVLPIPLVESPPNLARDDARRRLSIPSDHLMLLTVGRPMKYRPTQSHDFFRTVRKVLDTVRNTHLYVVGLSEEEANQWHLNYQHPQIHLCGADPDPSKYRAAADLYLESMPFGSATALLETSLAGIPVVLPFAPSCDLFVTNHGLESIVTNPPTEEEYIHRILHLLSNARERNILGLALKEHTRSNHTSEGWHRQLASFYLMVEGLEHNAKCIPTTECNVSGDDNAVSEWQAFLNGDIDFNPKDTRTVRDIVLKATRRARGLGDYCGACELLWRYFRTFGVDRNMLKAAVELPAHRVYRWCSPQKMFL